MGQEYFINSQGLQDKIRTLLPSQGGAGAGLDLSASTQIVPVINLTETAEGSSLRQDLQTAVSNSVTYTSLNNTTGTDLVVNTGFYRVYISSIRDDGTGTQTCALELDDGTSQYRFFNFLGITGTKFDIIPNFDKIVFVKAGSKIQGIAGNNQVMRVHTYQIANIDGNLTNPLGF